MYQKCISQMKALEFRKRVLCDIVNNNICHYNISKWNPSSLNAIVILWREIWMKKIIIRKKHLFSSEKNPRGSDWWLVVLYFYCIIATKLFYYVIILAWRFCAWMLFICTLHVLELHEGYILIKRPKLQNKPQWLMYSYANYRWSPQTIYPIPLLGSFNAYEVLTDKSLDRCILENTRALTFGWKQTMNFIRVHV